MGSGGGTGIPRAGSNGIGHAARELDARPAIVVDRRHRGKQRLGIGVVRRVEDILRRTDLDDLPKIHHRDAVGEITHHPKVM